MHRSQPAACARTASGIRRRIPAASGSDVELQLPGRHNAMNALAALAAVHAIGIPLPDAAAALARFAGLKRRLETVGVARGVTVIDDFAHNPDKIAATLETLTAGARPAADHVPAARLWPARQDGTGACAKPSPRACAKATGSSCPIRSIRAARSTSRAGPIGWPNAIRDAGGNAEHIPERARDRRTRCWPKRLPGDRIAILGARDDTLSEFAADLVVRLGT